MKNKKTIINKIEEYYKTVCEEKRENLLYQLEKAEPVTSWKDLVQQYENKK